MDEKIPFELVSLEQPHLDPAAELFVKELRQLVNKHGMARVIICFQTKKGLWGRMIQPEVGLGWNLQAVQKIQERLNQMVERGQIR